jgi:hypothetical protein
MPDISTSIPKVPSTPPVGGTGKSGGLPNPMNSTNSAVPKTTPKPSTEGMALKRYRKIKQRVKYYELKKQLIGNLSKAEEFLYLRMKSRLKKARKLAAPELIQLNLKKKSSRGKGKRRGSDLSKLLTQGNIK